MLIRSICTLALLTGLASCGGEEGTSNAELKTYTDTVVAVDDASAAFNSGDYRTAAHAYGYAAENAPNDDYKITYTIEQAKSQAMNNDMDSATTTLQQLAGNHGEQLEATSLQGLADWSLNNKNPDLAGLTLAIAKDVLPKDNAFDFDKVSAGIAAAKSGDTDAMAALGYVGD